MKLRHNKLVGIDSMREWKEIGATNQEIMTRRTGRTTGRAFYVIARALKEPGKVFGIVDHYPSRGASRLLFEQVERIIQETGLRCMVLNREPMSIRFDLWGGDLK